MRTAWSCSISRARTTRAPAATATASVSRCSASSPLPPMAAATAGIRCSMSPAIRHAVPATCAASPRYCIRRATTAATSASLPTRRATPLSRSACACSNVTRAICACSCPPHKRPRWASSTGCRLAMAVPCATGCSCWPTTTCCLPAAAPACAPCAARPMTRWPALSAACRPRSGSGPIRSSMPPPAATLFRWIRCDASA